MQNDTYFQRVEKKERSFDFLFLDSDMNSIMWRTMPYFKHELKIHLLLFYVHSFSFILSVNLKNTTTDEKLLLCACVCLWFPIT